MKKALTPAAPVPAVPHSIESVLIAQSESITRLTDITARLALQVGELTEVSHQQATKHEVVARYIGLLEINQKGKVRVTRQLEAQALALFAGGMSQRDIAYNLGTSPASVNLIIHGKYPFAGIEAAKPRADLPEAIEQMLAIEREALYARADAATEYRRRHSQQLGDDLAYQREMRLRSQSAQKGEPA